MHFKYVGWMAAALATMSAACASSKQRSMVVPEDQIGSYSFMERVPDAMTLEGSFTVTRDTIVVDMVPGPCRYEPGVSATRIVYKCADVTVTFDRTNPLNRAAYSLVTTVTTRTEICVRYVAGRCVERRVETVEQQVPRSGRLWPHKIL